MKRIVSLLALASCLALAGCGGGHAAEVKSFIDERSEVAAQMATKVEASPNEAGVGEARKIFESKKADLSAKRDALKKADVSFDLYQQILHAEGTTATCSTRSAASTLRSCTGRNTTSSSRSSGKRPNGERLKAVEGS